MRVIVKDPERVHVLGPQQAAAPAERSLAALHRAWGRYHGNVEALLRQAATDENRSEVVAAIRKHAEVIESLREKVA